MSDENYENSNGGNENPYNTQALQLREWYHYNDVIPKVKDIFENNPDNKIILIKGNPGTGKTSILKRIKNHSSEIGGHYIPVYLDARNYKHYDYDDLLFHLFKDILLHLSMSGFDSAKPHLISNNREKGRGVFLDSYLLQLAGILKFKENAMLLLILDEFDGLLETYNESILSRMLDNFSNIDTDWSPYALIIAGSKRICCLSPSGQFNDFMEALIHIDIEDTLDEDSAKKAIIETAAEKLTYSEEAVKQIIWLSGKNMYFQRLICQKLYTYKKSQKDNNCSLEDVEQVAQKIMEEGSPEFKHGWENILSVEQRIFISAFADRQITKKVEDHYYFNEQNLLDIIYGEQINAKITILQEYGYINKISNRRFQSCPFKIPLYGRWINKNHPFILTFLTYIDYFASIVNMETLLNILQMIPIEEMEQAGYIPNTILEIIRLCTEMKITIKESKKGIPKYLFNSFFEMLSSYVKLDFNVFPHANDKNAVINLKILGIGTIEDAYCLILDKHELSTSEILQIENIATIQSENEYFRKRITILFYFQESPLIEILTKKTYLNLIAINERAINRILFSVNPRDTFKEIILNTVYLPKISIYRTEGPAKLTFYGRGSIIQKISNKPNQSYTIAGARKIGKTSLLHRIKDNPPPNAVYIFRDAEFDFNDTRNYKKFLKNIEDEVEKVFQKKISLFRPSFNELDTFTKIVHKIKEKFEKKVIFIIDESDALIEFDRINDFKLLKLFRHLSQQNICQFIFSGFKSVFHLKRDIQNPLYNFGEEIRLQPLDRESAIDLITKPMEYIGIRYENESDKDLILRYTACHPNLLQFFCKHLVEKIQTHKHSDQKRVITLDDIDELNTSAYEKYIFDEVYMFYTNLTDLEKLILVLLVMEGTLDKKFTTDQIRRKLLDCGIEITINDMYRRMDDLLMRFILSETNENSYSFALPIFPDILRKHVDKEFKIQLIAEVKKNFN